MEAADVVPQYQWHWVTLTLELGTKARLYRSGVGGAANLILSVDDTTLPITLLQAAVRAALYADRFKLT